MADAKVPLTSEQVAGMLNTNAAVVRRTMAGLREAGYVRSEKGHGGGWTLACDLRKVTLLDIYRAVGTEHIFAIGFDNDSPNCIVEQVVNASVSEAMKQAETLLIDRLMSVTLADLADQFQSALGDCTGIEKHPRHSIPG
jgi:DNA-binding IscR family transcriptional regulator